VGLTMFTIEMDWDETAITILDQDANYEDVQFIIYDDIVYIRQWDDDIERFNTIAMSPNMFDDFRTSLNLPVGSYSTERKSNE
jgi:hypothetical protein